MDSFGFDVDRNSYLDERKTSILAEHEQAASYDKWLMTLASGSLGLSITFFKEIAPRPIDDSMFWLMVAWAAFALSIIGTLASFLVSQSAHRFYVYQLDEDYIARCTGQKLGPFGKNSYSTCVLYLNIASLVAFTAGVGLLGRFCFLNTNYSLP